jgi:predicted PurR-regulated permease PerM
MSEGGEHRQGSLPDHSPIELRGAGARSTLRDALIWVSVVGGAWLAWQVSQAILLVVAGLIVGAGLQGGVRLIGKAFPRLGHHWRLTIVVLGLMVVLGGFFYFAGLQIAAQAGALADTLHMQATRIAAFAEEYGIHVGGHAGGDPVAALKAQVGGSIERVTAFLGNAVGALGSLLLVVTLGIFFAADPRGYERGVEWLTPSRLRPAVHGTLAAIGHMLRRWVLGRMVIMLFEGVFIALGLWLTGVPLAAVLGLVTGLLAFIPTLGALIAGVLIVLVGFSGGVDSGLWAIAVYLAVQLADNFVNPLIEKKAVDIAPAAVLAAQLVFAALFGFLGIALADPLLAMAKVALERRDHGDAAHHRPPPTKSASL